MATLMDLIKKQNTLAQTSAQRIKIQSLKEQLDATDYMIIKCTEFSLAKLDPPYDIAQVHADRQKLRDEINTLESEIKNIVIFD